MIPPDVENFDEIALVGRLCHGDEESSEPWVFVKQFSQPVEEADGKVLVGHPHSGQDLRVQRLSNRRVAEVDPDLAQVWSLTPFFQSFFLQEKQLVCLEGKTINPGFFLDISKKTQGQKNSGKLFKNSIICQLKTDFLLKKVLKLIYWSCILHKIMPKLKF